MKIVVSKSKMKFKLLTFSFIFLHFCLATEQYDAYSLANKTEKILKNLNGDYNGPLFNMVMKYSISQCVLSNNKPLEVAAMITSIYSDYCSVTTALLYYTNKWCSNNDTATSLFVNMFDSNVKQTYQSLISATQSGKINILNPISSFPTPVKARLELISLATILNTVICNSSLTTTDYAVATCELRNNFYVKYKVYTVDKLLSQIAEKDFKILQVKQFAYIDNFLYHHYPNAIELLSNVLSNFTNIVSRLNIMTVSVYGRVKPYYSIFNKMKTLRKKLHQLDDIIGARIILENKEDCFAVLKACHDSFEFDPRAEDDYITIPKPSGYQSLHTVLFIGENRKVELQIRTKEMDDFGESTHLLYKKTLLALLNANFDEEFKKVDDLVGYI